MKKIIFLLAITLAFLQKTTAQNIGINATGASPNESAILDISSTSKGLLIPRMTAAEKTAIALPATGLMIYQTDAPAGFCYFDGTNWNAVTTAAPGSINFRYTASTSQAINANQDTRVNFGTQTFLNNATFTNSTFIVPATGIYHCSVYLFMFSNAITTMGVSILANAVTKSSVSYNVRSSIFQQIGFSDNVQLTAGDVVSVELNVNSFSTVVTGNSTYFTAFKIN
jgi:hypothetical protein